MGNLTIQILGIIFAFIGIILLFYKKEEGHSRFRILGQEIEISTPAIVVFLVGSVMKEFLKKTNAKFIVYRRGPLGVNNSFLSYLGEEQNFSELLDITPSEMSERIRFLRVTKPVPILEKCEDTEQFDIKCHSALADSLKKMVEDLLYPAGPE